PPAATASPHACRCSRHPTEKVALVAGAGAAQTALSLVRGGVAPGVHSLGHAGLPNADILDGVLAAGVTLHQFVGV
ncbi:MAG: hypothetical protein ACKOQ7_02150, partial [Actinomycetota bacterium]